MQLRDRHVWITGASSGIGEALALACARAGARLTLSARREEKLADVAVRCRELGCDTAAVLPMDLETPDAFSDSVAEAERLVGPVDILVNNGGIGQRGTVVETDLAVVRRILEVNFFAAVELTRLVVPGMIERGGGQVIVTSSVLGKFGAPTRSAYAASKHALQGFFDSLRAEVHDKGVRVTVICPGFIRTEISEHALEGDGSPHGVMDKGQARGLSAETCAEHMLRAIEADREEIFIGGWTEWAGLMAQRFCPRLLARVMRRVDPNG